MATQVRSPGSAAPRRRLSAPERRDQILDVAMEQAEAGGFHALSIDGIAKAAGISRPIVYQHFGDLNGVMDALVDREGERALAQLASLLPTAVTSDPREQLVGALGAFLEAVEAEPVRWRMILMPPEGAPEVMRERFERERAGVTAQLAAVVGPAIASARGAPSPDAELLARSLQAFAEELARMVLSDPRNYPVQRMLDYARWALRLFAIEPA